MNLVPRVIFRRNVLLLMGCLILSGTSRANDKQKTMLLQTFVKEFVSITPGEARFPASFKMGSDAASPSEQPQHLVKMSLPFSIAKYEVPQNLYEAVMGSNPSRWKGPRNSVEMMTWDDANEFCLKITQMLRAEKLIEEDERIRLPTEAEWEYCCRAGTETKYSFGDNPQNENDKAPIATILNQYAWHTGNAAGNDPQVGALKPNPWGLYDFHGYLWEFTADSWTPDYKQTAENKPGTLVDDQTKLLVIRGGSWKDPYEKLTSTSRRSISRTGKDDAVGFRCVKSNEWERPR
jgi:formylglycine-generating enzyme required for sulfatase activity